MSLEQLHGNYIMQLGRAVQQKAASAGVPMHWGREGHGHVILPGPKAFLAAGMGRQVTQANRMTFEALHPVNDVTSFAMLPPPLYLFLVPLNWGRPDIDTCMHTFVHISPPVADCLCPAVTARSCFALLPPFWAK